MQTLLLISGELLLLPLLVAAALVAELVAGVVVGAIQLALGPLRRRRARASSGLAPIPVLGWLRRIRSLLVTLCTAIFVLVVAADLFFFESAIGWVFDRLGDRTGMAVEFERAEGSFAMGRLELSGMQISHDDPPGNAVNLSVESFVVDVAMLDLFRADRRVQELRVEGIEGEVVLRRKTGATPKSSGPPPEVSIDELRLSRVSLQVRDETRPKAVPLELELDAFAVAPLRGDHALYDLLHGATGRGRLATAEFEVSRVSTAPEGLGRWEVRGLPLSTALPYFGLGADWIGGGAVDVALVDDGPSDAETSLDCSLTLRDVRVRGGGELGGKEKAFALALEMAVAKLGAEIPLEFSLEIPAERLANAATISDLGLLPAASAALAKSVFGAAGPASGTAAGLGRFGAGLLDRVTGD